MLRMLGATACVLLVFASCGSATQLLERQPTPEPPADTTEATGDGPLRTVESSNGPVKIDVSGKGAVLCTWSIYVAVQAATNACGWERGPADDALDAAISEFDAFIIANSPVVVTQSMLDERKRVDREMVWGTTTNVAAQCNVDPETQSMGSFAWSLRQDIDPPTFLASTRDMLSVPREPLMNPCL